MSLKRDAMPDIMPLRARNVLDKPEGAPCPNKPLANGSLLSPGASGDRSEVLSRCSGGGVETLSRFDDFESSSASFISRSLSFLGGFLRSFLGPDCEGEETSRASSTCEASFDLVGMPKLVFLVDLLDELLVADLFLESSECFLDDVDLDFVKGSSSRCLS